MNAFHHPKLGVNIHVGIFSTQDAILPAYASEYSIYEDLTERGTSIPSYGAPYPPKYVNINNVTSLQELSRAVNVRMTTWINQMYVADTI
jgi:hypothetical protein